MELKAVLVMKRSLATGCAGMGYPVFLKDTTYILLKDTKATCENLADRSKSLI